MTRILYIHHGTGIGGAPLSLLGLIRGLDRTAFEPVVLCLYASAAVGLFQRAGIETYVARTSRDFSHTALDWYRLTRPRDLVRLADRLALALPTVLETRRLLVRLRP
ncbi:MAG TPA: hypothetical protein VGW35_25475, partial [Methylomirabilota bacterium]|nr:hypothetical protein [Methylomirabilota bacterium]